MTSYHDVTGGYCVIASPDERRGETVKALVVLREGYGATTPEEIIAWTRGEMAAPPAAFGPAVSFETTFAAPGRYKIWAQFNHHGQVLTVAYVVEVR